jgi:hypothetical protein
MGQMFMYDLYQVSFEGNAVTQKYYVTCGTVYNRVASNVAAVQVILVLCILEVPNSNLGPEVGYSD